MKESTGQPSRACGNYLRIHVQTRQRHNREKFLRIVVRFIDLGLICIQGNYRFNWTFYGLLNYYRYTTKKQEELGIGGWLDGWMK